MAIEKNKTNAVTVDIRLQVDRVLDIMKKSRTQTFATDIFITYFQKAEPKTWAAVLERYGAGGKGAGRRYTANNRIGKALDAACARGKLVKLSAKESHAGWGSPGILVWSLDLKAEPETVEDEVHLYPEEAGAAEGSIWEGALKTVKVNRFERNTAARKRCIDHHGGAICKVCTIDFGKRYGSLGKGFIHVHHLRPLHKIREAYKVDPVKDLVPICPNCHAMIHRGKNLLSISALIKIIKSQSK